MHFWFNSPRKLHGLFFKIKITAIYCTLNASIFFRIRSVSWWFNLLYGNCDDVWRSLFFLLTIKYKSWRIPILLLLQQYYTTTIIGQRLIKQCEVYFCHQKVAEKSSNSHSSFFFCCFRTTFFEILLYKTFHALQLSTSICILYTMYIVWKRFKLWRKRWNLWCHPALLLIVTLFTI